MYCGVPGRLDVQDKQSKMHRSTACWRLTVSVNEYTCKISTKPVVQTVCYASEWFVFGMPVLYSSKRLAYIF